MLQCILLTVEAVVAVGFLLWLVLGVQKRRQESRVNYYLKLQKSLMDEHYVVLQNQIAMTRRLRHDLANHIQVMEHLEKSGKTEEFLKYEEQLKELYAVLKKDGLCPDYVLDAMLVRRKTQCAREQISFKTALLTVDGGQANKTDLMIVFYELTAYGMKRAKQSSERSFRLEGNQENGYLFLRLTCPVWKKESVRGMNARMLTELAQTRTIADKYCGNLYGELKGGWEIVYFTMRVVAEVYKTA